ncbi:MFS transporter [Roseomonas sp. NAR14]|uniref:MFS transporter n=1 Tax=Roseomonas acroporae TaxID=2937791 RepID=A0A9X1Y563_9PROT|nr:MFS transporter [Roseomonas acroporae]MCK8784164.1 MFS transporter [Roseomonas acroporae]
MLEALDRRTTLTGNQRRIVVAAVLGDMLEFFDYFLIGFVLAFVVGPWQLTFGQSAVILLSSGIGAMLGAVFWGRMADRIGRRPVFVATILNFSIATGALAFTPDGGWLWLTAFRFVVGFGVGGLYCVDLPLVQEFMPKSKRGRIGGLVTSFIPVGTMLGAVLAALLAPLIGWRGLFAVGVLPALLVLLVRMWVPESPHWLLRQGRREEARRSVAWALEVDPRSLPLPEARSTPPESDWRELFRHPRSLAVSWLTNLGGQTGSYGLTLWAPTLFVLLLHVPPAQASSLMILVTLGGLAGRFLFSWLSDGIGRRASGGLAGFAGAAFIVLAGLYHNEVLFGVSAFWLLLIAAYVFVDGGFAIIGPYAAEVWPASLRTTGMGSAYGFGGIGKIIGPLGLALVVGSSNVIKPEATVEQIVPAFLYLAGWFALVGVMFLFFGIETRGRSIGEIDRSLTGGAAAGATVGVPAGAMAVTAEAARPPAVGA